MALISSLLALPAAAEIPTQLPDSDDKLADQTKPVKVFIMLGQSNMLGFGHVMGFVLDEPVLLLKACVGNRSLGWDLLPPGSERFEFEGKTYAGYRDVANFWDTGTEPKPVPWYAGRQYDADNAHAKAVLKNLEKYYPEFKGNVKTIDARPLWRDADVSPVNQGYHYNHNAETYYEVGDRQGRAMAQLLEASKLP